MSGNEEDIKKAQEACPEAGPAQIALTTGASVHEVYEVLDKQAEESEE